MPLRQSQNYFLYKFISFKEYKKYITIKLKHTKCLNIDLKIGNVNTLLMHKNNIKNERNKDINIEYIL